MSFDDEYVREYVRLLTTEDTIDPPDISRLNGHREQIETLYMAHQKGGRDVVQRELQEKVKLYPDLVRLVNTPRRLYRFDELKFLPRPTWLTIDGIQIQTESLVMLYGPTNKGKTFVGLHMALTLAKSEAGVYIAGEGCSSYGDRYEAWCKHHHCTVPEANIYIEAVNMLEPATVDRFISDIEPIQPKWIVIDTVAVCMAGGEENTSQDMGWFVNACKRLIHQFHATVIIIHHPGKDASRGSRGHYSLEAGCDTIIQLSQDPNGLITLACQKQRNGVQFPDVHMRLLPVTLDTVNPETGEHITNLVVVAAESGAASKHQKLPGSQTKILEALDSSPRGLGSKAIENSTGLAKATAQDALGKLKSFGLITQEGKGNPYFITEKGQDYLTGKVHSPE